MSLDFSDLQSYYPGSREQRQTVAPAPAAAVDEDVLGDGIVMVLNGRDTEFFTIGQVARALGRKAGTLRAWEAKGILPSSGYVKPSKDPRGRRRLFTRPQAEAIIRLAQEHGVMDADERRPLGKFGSELHLVFHDLRSGK